MKLRDYQEEIINILKKDCQFACKEIVQLPTGMGKTVVFAHLIKELNKRTLIIAHREELLEQARQKLVSAGITSEIDVVLQSQPNQDAQHWIASVQTLVRGDRLTKIKPELLIIDECHHSVASTYKSIIDAFPNIPVIGFTATPTRTGRKEKEAFGQMWDKIAYEYSIKKAILDKYLANIKYYQVKTNISLDEVKTKAGDLDEGQLAETVNTLTRNQAAVDKYKELGGGKAIVFCVNCEHANNMVDTFSANGIESYCILGSTKERKEILGKFQSANMNQNIVLVNVMVLTEGWDCPDIRMVILARPTMSQIVYLQQLGRGTRITDEKKEVIVVDIADNCKKKQLCSCLQTVFNLRKGVEIEGDIVETLMEKKEKKADEKDSSEKLNDAIAQENVEIELAKILFDMPEELERSSIAWFAPQEKIYYCQLSKGVSLKIEDNMINYRLWLREYGQQDKLQVCDPNLLEIVAKAEDMAESGDFNETDYMWDKKRRKKLVNNPPTEKQVALINKIAPEIDCSAINCETASQIIGAHISKKQANYSQSPSDKQLAFLRFNGCYTIPKTKGEASKMIANIKGRK